MPLSTASTSTLPPSTVTFCDAFIPVSDEVTDISPPLIFTFICMYSTVFDVINIFPDVILISFYCLRHLPFDDVSFTLRLPLPHIFKFPSLMITPSGDIFASCLSCNLRECRRPKSRHFLFLSQAVYAGWQIFSCCKYMLFFELLIVTPFKRTVTFSCLFVHNNSVRAKISLECICAALVKCDCFIFL